VRKLLRKIPKMSVLKKLEKNNFLFNNQRNNIACLILILLIFILDRISKIKIINHQINNNRVYINEFINFDLIWNTGIGFGLLSFNSALIYGVISLIIGIVIIFLIYLMFKSELIDKIIFSIILGGALGNFYDRLTYSAVPDFIDFHYKNFHWFTFNIADIFITIGIIMLILKDLFNNKKNG
tara:strand:+ start:397 stop:942 length:546 start_codon:yes stop_codon:yes gene_type:complete